MQRRPSSVVTVNNTKPRPQFSLQDEGDETLDSVVKGTVEHAGSGGAISTLLCQKLNALSMEERTQGMYELHGVDAGLHMNNTNREDHPPADTVPNSAATSVRSISQEEQIDSILLQTKLKEMDDAIRSMMMRNEDTYAYRKAIEMDIAAADEVDEGANDPYVSKMKLYCLMTVPRRLHGSLHSSLLNATYSVQRKYVKTYYYRI